MPKTMQSRFRLALSVLALGLLAASGVATVVSINRTAASVHLVEHTFAVISRLRDYNGNLRAAESSARGYRLTESVAMQEEFRHYQVQVRRDIEDLATLVADNPLQIARVRQLRRLTDERLSISRRLIEAPHLSLAHGTLSAGAVVMHRIDGVLRDMLGTEQALLAQRQARSAVLARRLVIFIVGGTSLSLLLIGLLLRNLLREVQRSRQLEREAIGAAAALQGSITELARVSDQRAALARYASLLQSCQGLEEAFRVTGHVVGELLPGVGGRCYLLRASRDVAESAIEFGTPTLPSAHAMRPADCWALRRGRPYLVADVAVGATCAHVDAGQAARGGWTLCVPLSAQGAAMGLLHVNGGASEDPKNALVLLEGMAEQLGLALSNLQLRESLRMQSLRDALTGLYNRRYLDESLPRELSRCERRGTPLAVLMLDIDHFKAFNDAYGHGAGDALLSAIARELQAVTRDEDLACRYGGEEFTVVLVDTARQDALRVAEEIRAAIARVTVQHLRQTLGPCTVSIGLAMLPEDGDNADALLKQADAALYRAKNGGRDRVVSA